MDAEIRGGRIDVETVRALCAVPPPWGARGSDRDSWLRDPDRVALLRRGCELHGAYLGVEPSASGLWGEGSDPYAPPPPPPAPDGGG